MKRNVEQIPLLPVTLANILELVERDDRALQDKKNQILENRWKNISPLVGLPKELWHMIICYLKLEFYWARFKATCGYFYYLARCISHLREEKLNTDFYKNNRTAPIAFSTANLKFNFDPFIRAHPKVLFYVLLTHLQLIP